MSHIIRAPAPPAILLNTAGLLVSSGLPFALGVLGCAYLATGVLPGGTLLLAGNLRLAQRPSDRQRALASFHTSNLFLLLLFLGVAADVIVRRW